MSEVWSLWVKMKIRLQTKGMKLLLLNAKKKKKKGPDNVLIIFATLGTLNGQLNLVWDS